MIDRQRKCIFIHQRKVAGTSIISAFGWAPKDPEWRPYNNGILSPEWRSRSPEERSYFVFSAVRNPFDRFVSAWKYLRAYRDRPILDVLRDLPQWGHDYRHMTRPQVAILRDPVKLSLITHEIMRFERLQADFDGICDRLGLARILLPHTNASQHRPHYRAYFNDEARELAAGFFKDDLETFGYEF